MRVAAIYDIHGNLPALEAVLREIREAGADQVLVGGDVVPGPMPADTVACLLDLDIPVQFILGNGEVAVLEQMAGREPAKVPVPYRPIIRWTARSVFLPAPNGCWRDGLRPCESRFLDWAKCCFAMPRRETKMTASLA